MGGAVREARSEVVAKATGTGSTAVAGSVVYPLSSVAASTSLSAKTPFLVYFRHTFPIVAPNSSERRLFHFRKEDFSKEFSVL